MNKTRSRRGAFALAIAALTITALPSTLGCGGGGESIALVGGERVDPTLIDRDPLALLPSGVLVLGYLEATSMFRSSWGPDVGQVISNVLPLGPESNFVPQRDVTRVYSGIYAMQGADFCAVVQGNFDVDAIRRAADSRAITIGGAPMIKTRYADNDLYTAGNVGFVVLTPHTVLTGNETGMRRALDRLRFGKLERSVSQWMIDLTSTPNAAMAFVGDLSTQPAVEAASQKYPFLGGLRTLRIVGNFQPPGMNFAGSITYRDAASATTGADSLQKAQQIASVVSLFASIGFGATLPTIQVAQNASDVAFTMPVDDSFVRFLIRHVSDMTRPLVTVAKTAPG